jgi:hypothetical protein
MQEIVTVTKFGKGSPYYEVASTHRSDGTSGSLGAFSRELEALQYAQCHFEKHRGTDFNPVLQLTDAQREVLEQGTVGRIANIPTIEHPDLKETE